MLGESVSVYLDGGSVGPAHESGNNPGSTIVDATGIALGKKLVIVRHGAIPDEAIFEALQ